MEQVIFIFFVDSSLGFVDMNRLWVVTQVMSRQSIKPHFVSLLYSEYTYIAYVHSFSLEEYYCTLFFFTSKSLSQMTVF